MSDVKTILKDKLQDVADATVRAEKALDEAAYAAAQKADTVGASASQKFSQAAARMEDIARRGLDKAREASGDLRDHAREAGDQTAQYIQKKPFTSVLLAALAGMGVAALLGMRRGTGRSSRH